MNDQKGLSPYSFLCPICEKRMMTDKYRPFCSNRCARIDLGHWLTEEYSVMSSESFNEEDTDVSLDDKED